MNQSVEERITSQVSSYLTLTGRYPSWIALGTTAWKNLVNEWNSKVYHTLLKSNSDKVVVAGICVCGEQIRVQKETELNSTEIVLVP